MSLFLAQHLRLASQNHSGHDVNIITLIGITNVMSESGSGNEKRQSIMAIAEAITTFTVIDLFVLCLAFMVYLVVKKLLHRRQHKYLNRQVHSAEKCNKMCNGGFIIRNKNNFTERNALR